MIAAHRGRGIIECIALTARSIVMKMNYLYGTVEAIRSDVIGVKKSWANSDVLNETCSRKIAKTTIKREVCYYTLKVNRKRQSSLQERPSLSRSGAKFRIQLSGKELHN
jgi:hypothetical protein